MKISHSRNTALLAAGYAFAMSFAVPIAAEADDTQRKIAELVDGIAVPVMKKNSIPGLAVGVTVAGKHYIFNYGLADRDARKPVTNDTLFEVGSLSKTFAATLGGYALAQGAISLSDATSKHLTRFAETKFDKISLLDLGTYTAGALPLQFPDDVTDDQSVEAYFRTWRPDFPPGTQRLYSNPSIGLFGYIAAKSLRTPYVELMQEKLFPAFQLEQTFIHVPKKNMSNYAFGYNKQDKPVRVTPGPFDAQAYGVKTTAEDLLRFVDANLDPSKLDPLFQKAIAATHKGYYRFGETTQSLGWELYPWPTSLDTLLRGNSSDMALKPQTVKKLAARDTPTGDVLTNKTGSTNGFGAYAAFVPSQNIGVVLLANRNYPITERVTAAHRILESLGTK